MKIAVPDLISNSYFPVPAAVELGYFEKEGLDMSYELVFPVDDANKAMRDGAYDFVGGSAHSTLAAFPEWDGAKLVCALSQGMYWLLVARDVSKMLRLEQMRRDFVANVSHELRTPLTVVHGYLDMLEPSEHPDWAPMPVSYTHLTLPTKA